MPSTSRTVTAAGNVTLTTADVGGLVELSAQAGQQVVQLPTLSGFSLGDELNLVCKQDDALFGNWPVMVEAVTSGQMQTQPQIAGWDHTAPRVQMGLASSLGARVRALRLSNRWLVTGDLNIPTPNLAPDQIADLEWWHDADQSTLTLSTNDVTAWASKAGSIGGSLARVSATAAVQEGTPGTANYGIKFDLSAAGKYYQVTRVGQAITNASFFIVVQSAAGTVPTNIWDHNDPSAFGVEPVISYSTISGRIQSFAPDSIALNLDTTGHAALPCAFLHVYVVPGSYGYLLRPSGIEYRTEVDTMTGTITANTVARLGQSTAAARTFKVFTIARFARVLSSTEWQGLANWARARWGIP